MSRFIKKFEVHKVGSQEGPILILSGAIMEDAIFPMAMIDSVQMLTFDLKDVTRINSSGVQLWSQWMSGIKAIAPNAIVILRHCPKFFIDILNSFKDFAPAPFIVQSFYIPFFCEGCDEHLDELLVRRTHFNEMAKNPEVVQLPKPSCPKCKIEMEADIFPGHYFRFLKTIRRGISKLPG